MNWLKFANLIGVKKIVKFFVHVASLLLDEPCSSRGAYDSGGI